MISRQVLLVLGVSLTATLGWFQRANAEEPKAVPATQQPTATEQPTKPGAAQPTPPKVAPVPPVAAVPAPRVAAPSPKSKAEPTPTAKVETVPQGAKPEQPAKVEQPALEAAAEAPARIAPAAAAGMPREPSIYETGRVGKMGVSDSGVKIKQTQERPKPKEQKIEEKAFTPEGTVVTTQPNGVLNQAVFGRELRPRFALLKDCRIEVARQKRTDTASVAASHLILRWTVLPNGSVSDTQVVATSPVDGRVMDCVKRQMSQWSFSPPTGGAARVERPFKFQ